MYCRHCGSDYVDGSKFCQNCGAKLEIEQNQTNKFNSYDEQKAYDSMSEQQKGSALAGVVLVLFLGLIGLIISLYLGPRAKKAAIITFIASVAFLFVLCLCDVFIVNQAHLS